MTADERDRLLDLHRAAIKAGAAYAAGSGPVTAYTAADDAFRDYLMGLEITQ